jgi:Streptomyces sporulation and cell division protein, SsgA
LARHDDKEMTAVICGAEVGLRLVTTLQRIVPPTGCPFLLPSGPYAVRLAFRAGLEEPVEWIFARDLVSRGIQGRQGIGGGHVRPSPGPAGGEPGGVLNIELISPYGPARFGTPGQGSHQLPAPGLPDRPRRPGKRTHRN